MSKPQATDKPRDTAPKPPDSDPPVAAFEEIPWLDPSETPRVTGRIQDARAILVRGRYVIIYELLTDGGKLMVGERHFLRSLRVQQQGATVSIAFKGKQKIGQGNSMWVGMVEIIETGTGPTCEQMVETSLKSGRIDRMLNRASQGFVNEGDVPF